MAHQLSSAAGFSLTGEATSILSDISGDVNNLTINGGNGLVEDTGLGDAVRTETRDIGIVNSMSITGMVNTTTEAIFGPLINGTSVTKSVQAQLISGLYLSGTANVGPVSFSIPIGLQTFTAEFRSSSGTGFDRTSVAL